MNTKIYFANSAVPETAELVSFTNDLAIGDDGWAQLAPFGDFPGRAMLRRANGEIQTFDAIQRLDRAAAEGMTSKFKSPWHRVKRFITGCHIYAGHPDVPAFANDYPDKSPKGMIVDLAVRDDGLYCKPVFTNEGSELVEAKKYRAFSGYWSAERVGEDGGRAVFRPDFLKSAGLTNRPNLPVHLMNEQHAPQSEAPAVLRKLVPWLAWHGVTLANEATEEQIETALAQMDAKLEKAAKPAPGTTGGPAYAATIHDLNQKIAAAQATFVNERQARIEAVLDLAIGAGQITPAQRNDWAAKLGVEAHFANELAALRRNAPVLKTRALTLDMGGRKIEIANAASRQDAVQNLVRAEMAEHGGGYDRAFATVRKAHPALFEAMQQPLAGNQK